MKRTSFLNRQNNLLRVIRAALKEDIGNRDITTTLVVPLHFQIRAVIIAKDRGILCGIDVLKKVFENVDKRLKIIPKFKDGETIKENDSIVFIRGQARSILTGERVALNFLSLLSGIATYTNLFVQKIKGTKALIKDTRKTPPLLRDLVKYAVRIGGGSNHRWGLWDGILIKDNHLKASHISNRKGIEENLLKNTLKKIKEKSKFPIEIEVENFNEFKKVIQYQPDIIMLDNFKLSQLKKAVEFRDKYFPHIKLEASGGINFYNVNAIAKSGVDFISVGAITHSAPSLDFSLEVLI